MRPSYLSEFLMIAAAHLLAVASPGPDFALIARQSLAYGRQTAVWSSIGIGLGILLHTTYSLLGIGLLIKNSPLAFTLLKGGGALYLAYIGWQSLRATAPDPATAAATVAASDAPTTAATSQPHGPPAGQLGVALPTRQQALGMGFLTNALNPKATLFFLALFSVVISPTTPTLIKVGYGLWMATITAAWFSAVSLLFSHPTAQRALQRGGHWGERVMGAILIALSIRLILT